MLGSESPLLRALDRRAGREPPLAAEGRLGLPDWLRGERPLEVDFADERVRDFDFFFAMAKS
jgi:hypothetical protein